MSACKSAGMVRPVLERQRLGLAACRRVRGFLSWRHPRGKSKQSHPSLTRTRLHRNISDEFRCIYSQRGHKPANSLATPSPLHWSGRRQRVRCHRRSQFRAIAPLEAGINHFNSGPNSSRWTFAAQAKAGIRINVTDRIWAFGEYRFLHEQATDYTFGSTVYPTHIATTNWNVHIGSLDRNLAVGGIGVSF